jgi:hypothetical protein
MRLTFSTRRALIAAAAFLAVTGATRIILPARAQGVVLTQSMPDVSNSSLPGASIFERICAGGFWMISKVHRAGNGVPFLEQRIQMWADTTEGQGRDRHSRGATLTDANGEFRLEVLQILPVFEQAHGHLAHIDPQLETAFLRP